MTTLPTDVNDSPNYTSDDHADHHNALHAVNNVLNAKGDLPVATAADTWSRLAVGTDGQVLTAASGQSTGLQWASLYVVTANRQTGNYTLVIGDAGLVVEMNVAGANTLTVPPNSSVAFATGTILEGVQYGAGQTTITPGSGVTIRSAGGKLKTTAQYSSFSLRKIGTDEWIAAGDLST